MKKLIGALCLVLAVTLPLPVRAKEDDDFWARARQQRIESDIDWARQDIERAQRRQQQRQDDEAREQSGRLLRLWQVQCQSYWWWQTGPPECAMHGF
jgi:hypothetical protein